MVDNNDVYVIMQGSPAVTLQKILDDDGFTIPATVEDRVANLEDIVATLGEQVASVGSRVSTISDKITLVDIQVESLDTTTTKVNNV